MPRKPSQETTEEDFEIPYKYGESSFVYKTTTNTSQTINSDSWIKTRWRPWVAWQYILVCIFDFIIGPVLTMLYFNYSGGEYVQWLPLTLQGGGLYHLAMGAVLGITSWSRGQEKLHRIEE